MFVNSSNSSVFLNCFSFTKGSNVFFAFTVTNALLLLPLSALVLYVGLQRWRPKRPASTVAVTSHTDLFTYHMLAMEVFSLMGSACFCSGIHVRSRRVMISGIYLFSIILPGQALFHCLTCVERYLAVVHPITFLSLRRAGGIRLRNISIGCSWLLCGGWMGVTYGYIPEFPVIPFFILFTFSLLVSSFCSLSILYALTRPGPGEGGKDRADRSKRRVFHTIMAIMATLLLRFAGILVCMVAFKFILMADGDPCVVVWCAFWFCLPSSLVLPLLFLHRAGELACFKRQH